MSNVKLTNIHKSFGAIDACLAINITINKGEFFTFLGPSGCGKTTILRMIAGFLDPDIGVIELGGHRVNDMLPEERKVGLVFQNYALFPFMNVYENVAYSLKIQKMSSTLINEKVTYYLDMVKLQGYEQRTISQLSGGEQQRVALARSLAMEPKVLLLDEPLSNLDAKLRVSMRQEMKSIIKKLGITTIFVTHDQTEALALSDRIAVFNKGQCQQIGTPEEIYDSPNNSFVAAFIGDTNLWPVKTDGNMAIVPNHLTIEFENDQEGQYISIRPQNIDLRPITTQGNNIFQGIIISCQLTGLFYQYEVAIGEIIFKVAQLNILGTKNLWTVNDHVSLYINPKVVKLLRD